MLPNLIQGSADFLPWPDNSFDVILSINTMHNLDEKGCVKSIQEMNRVSRNKNHIYLEVDAYRTNEEKEKMQWWVLTAETVKSVDEWLEFYKKAGYEGDYNWMIV